MPNANVGDTKDFDGFTRSELNAFRVTSMLAGSFLMLIVWVFIPRLVAHQLVLPEAVWFGLGVGLMGVPLFPWLRMQARLQRPPKVLTWPRFLWGAVNGSLVSGVLFALLQKWL